MNLPVIFNNVARAIKTYAGTGALLAKKHAPEIMVASGVAGFIVTIVETVKATNETNEILGTREIELNERGEIYEKLGLDYTEEMYNEDTKDIKRKARVALFKAWFPVVTTAGLSVILVLKGYKLINGRYVATVAAYKTLEAAHERYRSNVIEEFGKEVDWRMANDIKPERLEAIEKERRENDRIAEDNKGKKKKDRKPLRNAHLNDRKYLFDENSIYWKRYWTPRQFLDYIQTKVRQLQDKFDLQGYLFVNDVLEAFGLPKTAEGQVIGWIKKRGKTTVISVGYDEMPEEEIRRILATPNNSQLRFWLNMNPDGLIYTLIDDLDKDRYLVEY